MASGFVQLHNRVPFSRKGHHGFDYVGTLVAFTLGGYCDPDIVRFRNPLKRNNIDCFHHQFTVDEMKGACFLHYNDTISEQPINLKTLTRRLLDDALKFIDDHHDQPFFLYFPFPQTHIALFCDEQFCGSSKRGLYGDNINEMSWAVGEIRQRLEDLGIDRNTLSLFLSDNGPHRVGCTWGGSAGGLRGGKFTTWEGGMRVPAVATWPSTIPPGTVSDKVVSSLDILPTFIQLAGASDDYLQKHDVKIDGVVIKDLMNDSMELEPNREALFYYCSDLIMAVRYNQYKIHFYIAKDDMEIKYTANISCCARFASSLYDLDGCDGKFIRKMDPPLVFDLVIDPSESWAIDTSGPTISAMLKKVDALVQDHKSSMVHVDSVLTELNKDLTPCCNPPKCECNYG